MTKIDTPKVTHRLPGSIPAPEGAKASGSINTRYKTKETAHLRAWVKDMRRSLVGHRDEWTRGQRRMLDFFDTALDAVEEGKSREEVLRVGY